MHEPDASVILVLRDAPEEVHTALKHLEQQTYPAAKYEILIVDNASAPKSREGIARHAAGAPVKSSVLRLDKRVTPGTARNLAVRQARGHWLIFLDPDLLASPALVDQHLRSQLVHGGACAVVGKIEAHPQADPATDLSPYLSTPGGDWVSGQPLRFLDWRLHNLSLPREAVLNAHGFDEEFALEGLMDVELAWRLENSGVQGFYSDTAVAYVWRALTWREELARHYAEGFTLQRALAKTKSDILATRYFGARRPPSRAATVVLAPVYRGICHTLGSGIGDAFRLSPRMSRLAVLHGYADAANGRAPRYAN